MSNKQKCPPERMQAARRAMKQLEPEVSAVMSTAMGQEDPTRVRVNIGTTRASLDLLAMAIPMAIAHADERGLLDSAQIVELQALRKLLIEAKPGTDVINDFLI